MHFNHAVIWIDHVTARVLYFEDQVFPVRHFAKSVQLRARKAGNEALADQLLIDVCDALGDTPQLLLTGTPEAVAAFVRHVETNSPQVAQRIVGIQRVVEPTNKRLAALALWHFTRVLPPATEADDA